MTLEGNLPEQVLKDLLLQQQLDTSLPLYVQRQQFHITLLRSIQNKISKYILQQQTIKGNLKFMLKNNYWYTNHQTI